ncbi:hypothetical protein [Helicobacter mesocricetorum]|uniref:hypothetical protein n=1 Tax=Helicobacter mesocricetorum TaxID=87012 RepID=UPI001F33BCDD|nr:hypothetical protein [Helicobacter mesocricetorum]
MQNIEKAIRENTQINYNLLMSNIIIHSHIKEEDKQILLLLLQDRDRNYVRINPNQQCFENIQKYLELLRPLKVDYEDLVRVGGKGDGGYVMYKPNLMDSTMDSAGGGGLSLAKSYFIRC